VEGALAAPVLAGGAALTAAGVALGLRKIDYERIPQVAVLSSAFFVASLIHLPVGFTSAHLILNGLIGVILGWAAFPALLVALLLQSVFFGYGGLTALGVNTLNMAMPAVACYYLFGWRMRAAKRSFLFGIGFAVAFTGITLAAMMTAASLLLSGKEFAAAIAAMGIAHIPVIVVEGLVTGSVVVFLHKVRPELLEAPVAARVGERAPDA